MRQECVMTTVDNRAVLEQVEGGFVSLPVCTLNGCTPYTTYNPCQPYHPLTTYLTCPTLPWFSPV
jgi:hypothetical protein